MSPSPPCRSRRLAARGPIQIDMCSCGQVHVSIGPTTMRVAPPVLRALSEALRAAVAHLDPPSPPLPLQ